MHPNRLSSLPRRRRKEAHDETEQELDHLYGRIHLCGLHSLCGDSGGRQSGDDLQSEYQQEARIAGGRSESLRSCDSSTPRRIDSKYRQFITEKTMDKATRTSPPTMVNPTRVQLTMPDSGTVTAVLATDPKGT
jgi:hypothetical protein